LLYLSKGVSQGLWELTVRANVLLQISDLGQGGVLAARSQQITKGIESDTSIASLVEERKCFFVVCACLRIMVRGCHAYFVCRAAGAINGRRKGESSWDRMRFEVGSGGAEDITQRSLKAVVDASVEVQTEPRKSVESSRAQSKQTRSSRRSVVNKPRFRAPSGP